MWKRLSEAGFTTNHVILEGDLNHFEETNHKGITGECQMRRREAATWHHMTLHYGLLDAWNLDNFCKMTAKEFIFDNERSGPCLAIFHIDNFLIS
jgi:hypothetical protein